MRSASISRSTLRARSKKHTANAITLLKSCAKCAKRTCSDEKAGPAFINTKANRKRLMSHSNSGGAQPREMPEKQVAEETSARPGKPAASVIDTSKMSKGQREALELTEASRDPLDDRGSFASNLFVGRYDFERIHPFPEQSAEDRAAGSPFLQKLETYLRDHVDPDEIDRTGEIPQNNIDDLFE